MIKSGNMTSGYLNFLMMMGVANFDKAIVYGRIGPGLSGDPVC
jgi:hypothetical protein